MRDFLQKGRIFWLLLGLSFVLPCMVAFPQDADDDEDDEEKPEQVDPEAWKAAREEIVNAIRIEIDKRVKQKVKHENIVRDLNMATKLFETRVKAYYEMQIASFVASEKKKWERNMITATYPNVMARKEFQVFNTPAWKYPVDKPKLPMEMIKGVIEKSLDEQFGKAYPLKSEEELKKAGRQKYPLIELTNENQRPHVKFKLREGFGTNTQVEGRLQKINSERLQVQTANGTRMITRKDLSEETQALFYKDINAKYVQDYVDDEIRRYNALREGFVADWVELILPNALIAAGYVPMTYLTLDPKTKKPETVIRQSTNLKRWWTRVEHEARIYKEQFEAEKKRITPKVEKEFFEHAAEKELYSENFVYRKEDKEWVPESVSAERDAAAAGAPANPDGGEEEPPPM